MFVYHGAEPHPVESSVAQLLCSIQTFQKGDTACRILEGEKINGFTLHQQQAYKGGIGTEFQMTKKIHSESISKSNRWYPFFIPEPSWQYPSHVHVVKLFHL